MVIPHIQEQLSELNLGPTRSEVPLLAVSLALEAKASQRELTSRLLADLCGPVLACRDLESAFDKLLWELPDLVLDTPGAPQVNPPESIGALEHVQCRLSSLNMVLVDLFHQIFTSIGLTGTKPLTPGSTMKIS